MKTLRVCLSSELPDVLERSSDYLYFAYDKLILYSGQNEVSENFAIATEIPEAQIEGMIYILNTDGSVHRMIDYVDSTIAEIEDSDQIELLEKAGTLFYVDNNRRYLDSQKRVLTLPFNDGNYELSVAMKNDEVFNNNTVLKYSEDSGSFEISSDSSFEDYTDNLNPGTTNSAKVNINGSTISVDVKVSSEPNNILKATSTGLYAKTYNKVDVTTFEEWKKVIDEFKQYAQDVLDKINAEIGEATSLVTPEKIYEDEYNILKDKFATIQTAFDRYSAIAGSIDDIQSEVVAYAVAQFTEISERLDGIIEQNTEWEDLDSAASTYKHEIDYFERFVDYFYPNYTLKIKSIINAAIAAFLSEEG